MKAIVLGIGSTFIGISFEHFLFGLGLGLVVLAVTWSIEERGSK